MHQKEIGNPIERCEDIIGSTFCCEYSSMQRYPKEVAADFDFFERVNRRIGSWRQAVALTGSYDVQGNCLRASVGQIGQ